MKYKELIFEQLNNAPYFTKQVVEQLASKYSLSEHTIDSYITKGIAKGEIVKLRREFFVTKKMYETNISDSSYVFSLANRLRTPSYISLESALQYYGMFAEAVNVSITSLTPKVTREYKNRIGNFIYKSISPSLFSDYETIKGNFDFLIAKPYKAIFDTLYFRTNLFKDDFSSDILEDLRIDASELNSEDKNNLDSLISKFTSKKLNI